MAAVAAASEHSCGSPLADAFLNRQLGTTRKEASQTQREAIVPKIPAPLREVCLFTVILALQPPSIMLWVPRACQAYSQQRF